MLRVGSKHELLGACGDRGTVLCSVGVMWRAGVREKVASNHESVECGDLMAIWLSEETR